MRSFRRAGVIVVSAAAAIGALQTLAISTGALARGGHHHNGGDNNDPSSSNSGPSASFNSNGPSSQGSDASSGQPAQNGPGSAPATTVPDDTPPQQPQQSGNADGQRQHHHGHHRTDGTSDDSDSASASNAQGSNSDGTSNSAQGQGSGDATRKPVAAASSAAPASQPPKTVEEWFKRVFSGAPAGAPQQAAQEKPSTSPPSVKERPRAGPTPPVTVAAQKAKPVKPGGRPPPTGFSEFPSAEILVPKLSAEGLKRAQQLGFTENGKVNLTNSSSLARLLAPPGVSAEHALAMLNDALPRQPMGINEQYHPFKPTSEPDGPPTPMPTACGTDHCFGSNLIGWRPQLQACAKKVRIGVIDTSIDSSHPTFKKRQIEVRPRALARAHRDDPVAPNWHGTGVLSILAGDPQSGTPGLIPDGQFLVADVFYADAKGLPVSDTASLVEALDWLEQRHVDIVNMSLTGPHDELLQSTIERLSAKGILIVAAVGNDGPTAPPTYPSAYAPVLAVTAINKDLSSYTYAVRGDHVDVAAPGVRIWTAMPGGKASYQTGTSFAAPYATAVAASIYPALAVKSKASMLQHMNFVDLGPPGRDPIYGRGLVVAPYACAPEPDAVVGAEPAPAAAFVTTVSTAGADKKPIVPPRPTSPSAGR